MPSQRSICGPADTHTAAVHNVTAIWFFQPFPGARIATAQAYTQAVDTTQQPPESIEARKGS